MNVINLQIMAILIYFVFYLSYWYLQSNAHINCLDFSRFFDIWKVKENSYFQKVAATMWYLAMDIAICRYL